MMFKTFLAKTVNLVFGLSRTLKTALLIFLDLIIIFSALNWINTQVFINGFTDQNVYLSLLGAVIAVLILLGFGGYRHIVRALSLNSIPQLLAAQVFAGFVITALSARSLEIATISFFFVYTFTTFSLLVTFRALAKSCYQWQIASGKLVVAVYGAGSAGQQLIAALKSADEYFVKVFIDDNNTICGMKLDGIPILSFENFIKFSQNTQIDQVLVAIPSASRLQRQALVSKLHQHKFIVRTIPNLTELIKGLAQLMRSLRFQ